MNTCTSKQDINGLQNCSLCCRCASVWIYSQVSPKMLYLWIFAAPLHLCDRGDFGVLRFYCLAYDVSFLWILWWRVLTQRKGFFPGLRFTPVARTLELFLYVPFLLVGLHFFFCSTTAQVCLMDLAGRERDAWCACWCSVPCPWHWGRGWPI